jgi:hypothetical protein
MLETLKAKVTGESEVETQPPTEDKRTAVEEDMNTDIKVTGGRIPDDPADDYRYRAIWGERGGPTELPPDADASVTPLSASSAQLLSHGGRFGSAYCKIMYVPRGGWPANPEPGLLDRLTAHSSAGIQVKQRVEPMDREPAASEFKPRVEQKNKELYAKRQAGAPDAAAVADEKQELDATLRAIESGRESIYWVGVMFVVRAGSKSAVDDAAEEIERALAKDDLGVTTADWAPAEGMTTVSPIGKRELGDRTMTAMTGSALRCLFPFSTSSMIEEGGVLYGYHGLNDSPIVVDRFNRQNGYNQLVIGNIGAGKSFGVKLLLLRRLARDRDISGVIVDPRGGFRELIDVFGLDAESVTVGGERGINPLQIEPTHQDVLDRHPDMNPLGERIESVLAFFVALHAETDETGGLDAGDKAVLSRAIADAYADAGITKDPATHSRDSPLPEDVDRILGEYAENAATALGSDAGERELEKWADRAAELRLAMHHFRDGGRYDHLNQPTNIGLGEGGSRIVLLDTNQSEDSDAMPLTMKLLFDAIYERAKGPGRMIAAFDEVHKLLQTPGGLDWLSRAVRYSRHFLLSLVLISQTADEFFEDAEGNPNPKAKVIADNCPIKWLFRTTGLTDEHGHKLGLSEREIKFVKQATPGDRERGWSHSLLSVEDLGSAPVRVEAINETEEHAIDPPDPTPDGTEGDSEESDVLGGTVATDGGRQ